MPLIVRAAELGFDIITTCAALGVFTFCEPKLRACVITGSGRMPVPLNAAACGEFNPESEKFNVAERPPVTAGVNVRETAQLAFGARTEPHVVPVTAKSGGPASEIAPMFSDVRFGFESVADCTLLVTSSASVPKFTEGVTLGAETTTVPLRKTVCVKVDSLKVSSALRGPAAPGVKTIETVQLLFAATLLPQVVSLIEKSLALIPEIQMPLVVKDEAPELVNVTV